METSPWIVPVTLAYAEHSYTQLSAVHTQTKTPAYVYAYIIRKSL